MSSVIDMMAVGTLADAFPEVNPGARPFGTGVLVQLRSPKRYTASGIQLPDEAIDQERWMTTIGKVVSVGPLAYRDRDNPGKEWPEGAWCKVGDFVRCPKWGGDRWEVKSGNASARFVIYKDRELIAGIYGDPLGFKDYI